MPQNKSANAFTAATGLESLDNQMDVLIGTEHGPTTEIACPYHKLTSWLAKYVDNATIVRLPVHAECSEPPLNPHKGNIVAWQWYIYSLKCCLASIGRYGLMDMTSVYETEDCRFEPCFAHTFVLSRLTRG